MDEDEGLSGAAVVVLVCGAAIASWCMGVGLLFGPAYGFLLCGAALTLLGIAGYRAEISKKSED